MTAILPTTYPTCQTCKHWKQTGFGGMSQGECQKADPLAPHGNFAAMSRNEPTWADAYRLDLFVLTQPHFGCLLHSDLTEARA